MSVTLLHDAGPFRRGASFRTLDWAISAHSDVWPNNSRWLWQSRGQSHRVKVVGGVPVRDDGAVLHTNSSRYEWRYRAGKSGK